MVDPIEQVRGVPLGDVLHETDDVIVQEIPDHPDNGVIAHDGGDNTIAFGAQHVEKALADGDQQFPGASLNVLVEGDSVALEAENGSRVVLSDPQAVVDAVNAAAE